ncbi:flowering time control protein FCA [Actinidia rufa]|uniref:Flowering time control protein FCA n=1 Tax=Actinidia rufa TaxID=165716 RepID=A0A7J0GEE3_9ERIC|nr:flowering time control protein FCA [Actinidia rufa]
MDRHRGGDRYGNSPDSHHYRNPRGTPRASGDGPTNHHRRRSPNDYRDDFSGGGGERGVHHRPFDSPPRYPPGGGGGGGGGGGFRPMSSDGGGGGGGFRPMGGDGFGPNLSGQKRGFPFSGQGGSPDHFDGGNFAKLFVGSVPRTATAEDIRPLFEEHGNVVEVALIKDKRTGQQQGL